MKELRSLKGWDNPEIRNCRKLLPGFGLEGPEKRSSCQDIEAGARRQRGLLQGAEATTNCQKPIWGRCGGSNTSACPPPRWCMVFPPARPIVDLTRKELGRDPGKSGSHNTQQNRERTEKGPGLSGKWLAQSWLLSLSCLSHLEESIQSSFSITSISRFLCAL